MKREKEVIREEKVTTQLNECKEEKMGIPISLPEFECKRCGHKWNPRNPEVPEICPKCKSARWHTEKPSETENDKKQ